MAISLKGKVAWVTGASGGIGSSMVEELHKAGATVVSTDVAAEPAVTGERIIHRRCDIAKQSDIDAIAALCRDELGGLDILCNNAGILRRMDVLELTRELWDLTMEINLKGYFFCSQAAARLMKAQGRGGSIINTSSINADHVQTHGNNVHYSISKGGIRTMTIALAASLGKYGIRVNAIAPGSIVTGMGEGHWTPEYRAAITAGAPLGRLGVPSDIGPAAVYLASDEASYVTGAILPIHGGRTLSS